MLTWFQDIGPYDQEAISQQVWRHVSNRHARKTYCFNMDPPRVQYPRATPPTMWIINLQAEQENTQDTLYTIHV